LIRNGGMSQMKKGEIERDLGSDEGGESLF